MKACILHGKGTKGICSLYTAWERYKRLLKRCPMHGIDLKTQMDIVYHPLNDILRVS